MFLLNIQEDDMFQKMKQIIYYNADIKTTKYTFNFSFASVHTITFLGCELVRVIG